MRFFAAKAHGLHEAGNPLFPKPDNSRGRWFIWLSGVLGLSGLLIGLGVVIYGPYLELHGVEVVGLETLTTENIVSRVETQLALRNYLILPNRHRWFFRGDRVEKDLEQNFPLESVQVSVIDGRVVVTVVEDVFLIAFRSGQEIFFLDANGLILRIASVAEKNAIFSKLGESDKLVGSDLAAIQAQMPIVREKTETPHQPGETIFSQSIIQNLVTFNAGLHEQGIETREFESDEVILPWFTVVSDKPYLILFDAKHDVAEQLSVLRAVTEELVGTEELPKYVDVRFGTHVFTR